ncbi:subtilisin-like protease SBT3.5 [Canna indica]|uniref:Subtilisin-like protease SBT3.5 n=1 Tax=Canna indica TaxID=4628 RepID=A0AAQ3Q432_9LILI|nr:subtilisin-like protease SBT3.5 [Canna indica]
MGSQHNILSSIFLIFLFLIAVVGTPSSKLYIVYLGERKHEDANLVTASHHDMLSSLLGSKEEALSSIVYSYRHGFSGFAAMLTDSQAEQIAELPEVISIKPSSSIPLHTTRSWDFLGLSLAVDQQEHSERLLQRANFGDGVIIGIVDTGIWPESKSFDDHGYGRIPSRWKGTCEVGQNFTVKDCNRKIIGARWYTAGIEPSEISIDYLSPRDKNGHGSHTASTAAGSFVHNASVGGLGAGVARGGAPRARLAIYKACWGIGTCSEATVLKAIDDAVHDGVDILSFSLGRQFNQSYASVHAVAKGITVIFSAGNDGPLPQTLSNDLPWEITVGASTIDRSFPTIITLGENLTMVGQSFYNATKDEGFKELVVIPSCFAAAINSTDVAGKFVLCGDTLFAAGSVPAGARDANIIFSQVVLSLEEAKAKGVIFSEFSLVAPLFEGIICVLVDKSVLWQIYKFGNNTRSPMVKVSPSYSIVGSRVMAPRVAAFSSRGPSFWYPDLVKPDVTAPGVNILAAVGDSYKFESGTSMSCPHVSGVAALLKAVHPEWSPAAIKSALVTTAYTSNAYGFPIEANATPRKLADPFDFGGGQINPDRAVDPGLIYDVDPKDYLMFFNCANSPSSNACDLVDNHLYHLNLPSVSISDLKTSLRVWRTVTNVGDMNSIYKAVVESPPGVIMTVEPSVLEFNASRRTHSFALTFKALQMVQGSFTFGSLSWCDGGKHSVRIPVAIQVVIQDYFSDAS